MKVAFHTLGCKVNQNDSYGLAELFRERGYQIVPFSPGADIYVINTCTVTQWGDAKSRQSIHKAAGYQHQLLVVTGCYPQVAPEEVAAIPGVDLVIGMAKRPQIVDLVEEALARGKSVSKIKLASHTGEWISLPTGFDGEHTRANLKIEEGCNQFCSYCIVPYARGRVRSMPQAEVVTEFRKLLAAGYKEIVLSGIHLGVYGQDCETNLNSLLTRLMGFEGEYRIRLGSLEPADISPDLIETIINNPRICQHLHIPLQSGSERILKLMRRDYGLAYYEKLLDNLRKNNPLLAVGTDLIVGFPGETDEDFEATCNFTRAQKFGRMHIFRYSPRRGTTAAGFPNRIPQAVQERRSKRISLIAAETKADYMEMFLGKRVEVLFEKATAGGWTGLSGEYLRVEVESKQDLKNKLMGVRIEGRHDDNLLGKIIE